MDSKNTRILKAKISTHLYLLPFPLLIVLVAFLSFIFSFNEWPMKIVGILFSIFSISAFVFTIINLLPDRNYVLLNSEGIAIKAPFYSEFYYWNEIDVFERFYFRSYGSGGGGDRCAFYLKDPSQIPSWKRAIGVDGFLPSEVYGDLKPHELVKLLNEWKNTYAPSPE